MIAVRLIVPVLLLPAAAGLRPSSAAKPQDKAAFTMSADEKKLFELTNQVRKKHNLSPLTPNPLLFAVARAHSANMVKQDKLEHMLDGKDVQKRLNDANYALKEAGEILAYKKKKSNLQEVIDGWLRSKGHRETMLDGDFREIGIGLATTRKGAAYITEVFGTPKKK